MKNLNTFGRIYLFVCLLIPTNELFGQQSKLDSLAIRISHAIKLTDSINSPLPDSIRLVTIEHFQKVGMDPSEYFTKTDREFFIDKINNIGEILTYKIHNREDFLSLDHNPIISEDSQFVANWNKIKLEIYWGLEYFRIGGLRDYCFWSGPLESIRIGGWGQYGDNIWVLYNSNFSKVIDIGNVQ